MKKLFYYLLILCNSAIGYTELPNLLASCLELLQECSDEYAYIPRIFNPKIDTLLTDLSFDQLVSLMQQADQYGNNYIINGIAAVIVDRLNTAPTNRELTLASLQNTLTPHAYAFITKYINFKKHRKDTRACTSPELSIAEYISVYDVPLEYLGSIGILRFDSKNIISLHGMQYISLSDVGFVMCNDNCIIGDTIDPQFPADPFVGLPNAYIMLFNENLIESLPTTFFQSTPLTRQVNLAHNLLPAIPAALTSFIDQVALIDISFNQLNFMNATDFINAPLLDILYLDENSLTDLPETLLHSNTLLKYLHLDNNKLTSWPTSILDSLVELVYLDLRNNSLTDFAPNYIHRGAEMVLTDNPLTTSQQEAIQLAYPENNFVF